MGRGAENTWCFHCVSFLDTRFFTRCDDDGAGDDDDDAGGDDASQSFLFNVIRRCSVALFLDALMC